MVLKSVQESRDSNIEIDEATGLPKPTLDWFGGDELRARCFYEKYTEKSLQELTPEDMWNRLATTLSKVEKEDLQEQWEKNFNWLLSDWRFVPGGRIMHAVGTGRNATATNCYYTQLEEDSLEGIFEWCKRAAKTYSFGGGNGVDIGVLRPQGAPVSNCAGASSGAVSFMEIFSQTTGTIGQGGRRGALMISCPVDHPDIVDFVNAKRGDTKKVRYANISVKLTDAFMEAAQEGADFELRFVDHKKREYKKTINSRELWDLIIRAAWESAEPGLMFWDTIKRESPSEYCAPVMGTNPCGEQPLDHNGACTLGHLNMSKFVLSPFGDQAVIDWEGLQKAIGIGVRFLDNVVEYNLPKHAHPEQAEQARLTRRIGLGVTGLADMLSMLRIKYDSDDGIRAVDELFRFIRDESYRASISVAAEKGSFPLYDKDKHWDGTSTFTARIPKDIQDQAKELGLRNVCILTIAPVGSGSVLTGTSSGVEPVFAFNYRRRSESLSRENYQVSHPLLKQYVEMGGDIDPENMPAFFVASHQIDPYFRVRMQSTIQQYVDSAISSTVNLPRSATEEDVRLLYEEAWKQGLKGLTVYREGSREGILITEEPTKEPTKVEPVEINRPDVLQGYSHKIRTPNGNMYVTVNVAGGVPFEVFCFVGKSGGYTASFTEALGRMVSLALRNGIPVHEVIDQLKGIRGPDSVLAKGGAVTSVPDAIARVLSNYVDGEISTEADLALECSECQGMLVRENGCVTCHDCGSSKCG